MASAQLIAVHEYLRAELSGEGGRAVRCGPFLRRMHAASGSPALNYAVPDAGAAPSASDVAALVAAFAEDDLEPAVEYLPAVAPGVARPLADAAFRVVERLPVMCADGAADLAPPGAVAVRVADGRVSRETLGLVLGVRDAAFGNHGRAVEAGDVERLRTVVRDGVLAFAHEGGEIVGCGIAQPLRDGVTELAAVGVLAAERGRGIGGALVSVLARAAFHRGARLVFLTASGTAAGRVYARVGLRPAGELIHLRG